MSVFPLEQETELFHTSASVAHMLCLRFEANFFFGNFILKINFLGVPTMAQGFCGPHAVFKI